MYFFTYSCKFYRFCYLSARECSILAPFRFRSDDRGRRLADKTAPELSFFVISAEKQVFSEIRILAVRPHRAIVFFCSSAPIDYASLRDVSLL